MPKQTMIAIELDYSKTLLLPFTPEGTALANLITGAPLHGGGINLYGGDMHFEPYTGEPIRTTTVQIEMDPATAYVQQSQAFDRFRADAQRDSTASAKALSDAQTAAAAERVNLQGKISNIEQEMNALMGHLRELPEIDPGLVRGESDRTKTNKRNNAIREANEVLARLRELAGEGGES